MTTRPLPVILSVVTAALWPTLPAAAADKAPARWPQFRGPGAAGIADGLQSVPVEFGPNQNRLWTADLPIGHSSPVVWGDRIFVTGFVEPDKRLETLCLDRSSGRILWRKAKLVTSLEKFYEVNNPAASTPVTDGKSVFAYFGSYGLVAYDFDGHERWARPLPMAQTFFGMGTGTSPTLAGDRLLLDVQLDKESYLLALRTKDGKTAWKAPKPEWNGGWATPVTWTEGRETLVGVLNPGRFTAHDLGDGKERWWLADLPKQTCATPVADGGLLFLSASGVQGDAENVTLPPPFDEMLRYDANGDGRIATDEIPESLVVTDRRGGGVGNTSLRKWQLFFSGGKPGSFDRAAWDKSVEDSAEFKKGPFMQSRVLAVRTGGRGDVTKTHVEWSDARGVPEVPSPLLFRGRLYQVKNGGIVYCRDAKSGQKVFEARLGVPGGYYSSPVAANGHIYAASHAGVVVVFEGQDELQVLARNDLGEPILATPAVVDGTLYVRTTSHLYAFGVAGTPATSR